jgi:arginase
MFKHILLFPHCKGQLRKGVQDTPDIFRQFIKSDNFVNVKTGKCLFENLRNLNYENNSHTGPLLNIGGDHSMGIGSVSSSLQKYPNVKVLWFDAHADINTYSSSLTKNWHGMPLSFLCGIDSHPSLSFITNKLPFENLMYIGIRDVDQYEVDTILEKKIKFITVDHLQKDLYASINTISDFVGNDPVHISFDVDCIDIDEIASTGTPVEKGVKLNDALLLLNMLQHKNVINVDITELNFDVGTTQQKFRSLSNTLRLFERYLH